MGTGEFYDVPEIHLRTATSAMFASCINWRRSEEKAKRAGERLDLDRMRPEELPPCFIAVNRKSISLRTGWEMDHGKWEPTETHTNHAFRAVYGWVSTPKGADPAVWTRTAMVFRPKAKGASKSDYMLMMYTTISSTVEVGVPLLQEDLAFCCVFPVPKQEGKEKGKCKSSEVSSIPSGHADLSYSEVENLCNCYGSYLESSNSHVEENDIDGWNLKSIDPSGGSQKRRRSYSKPVGGSIVWSSFTKIYMEDSKETKVVYAACHHCGRLMSVTAGSTKSLHNHMHSCHHNRDGSGLPLGYPQVATA